MGTIFLQTTFNSSPEIVAKKFYINPNPKKYLLRKPSKIVPSISPRSNQKSAQEYLNDLAFFFILGFIKKFVEKAGDLSSNF